MKRNSLRYILLKVCVILFLYGNSVAAADLISSTENGKKTMSRFMVNLAKFITWPAGAFSSDSDPYRYCILGSDAMGSAIDDAMAGKNAKKRPYQIQRMELSDLEGAKNCHVVFVSSETTDDALPIIDGLTGMPILTVAELDNFAQYGGMIGFYGKGRKVAMAINKKRLEDAGLIASSRLYRASSM